MRNLLSLLSLLLLLAEPVAAQLIVTGGSTLTISKGSTIPVVGMDIVVLAGGRVNNFGVLFTSQNYINDGILATDICGPSLAGAGTSFGQVNASGTALLLPNAELEVTASYAPPGNECYTVILATTRLSFFGLESLPGGPWFTDYTNPSRVEVKFTGPFPVEWLSFTGQAETKGNRLTWATAREENTDYFAVERRVPRAEWTEIDRVTAAGQSSSALTYRFFDSAPATGENHYRLRQVDLDGQFSYSDLVIVDYRGVAELRLFPNPSEGTLSVFAPPGTTRDYTVYDGVGRQVAAGTLLPDGSGTEVRLPTHLPAGTYHLRIGDSVRAFQLR